MKKLLHITVLFFMMILIVSSSPNLMQIVYHFREAHAAFRCDKEDYGDLYAMSFLKKYKFKKEIQKPVDCSGVNNNINLFVIGDSYLSNFAINNCSFKNVKNYTFFNPNNVESMVIKTIKGEKNILLIETVERNLKLYEDADFILKKVFFNDKEKIKNFSLVKSILYDFPFFNKNINQNIEYILFNYDFFIHFKELKAAINYTIFNRISGDVCLSPDRKYLLYKFTVDSTCFLSSFIPVSDKKINQTVNSLNYLYAYFKKNGFDEVYFSAIPNPVTILYPNMGIYNKRISRIQNHPDLKIPIVDVMEKFKSTKLEIYYKSDTHWNKKGYQIWLSEFNNKLNNPFN